MNDFRVVEHDEFDVYFALYDRLGPVMEQIAIAREKTFRAVGEGTGLSQDSDEFDPHYRHLFLWDKRSAVSQEPIGLVWLTKSLLLMELKGCIAARSINMTKLLSDNWAPRLKWAALLYILTISAGRFL